MALRSMRRLSAVAAKARNHVVPDELIEHNGGLLEYSVVYTDRALNHMSSPFQEVMLDLHGSLTRAYNAASCVLVPGSGTYAMEAAARAFGSGDVVVVRNGYFSYRWSQIFEAMGKPESQMHVLKARFGEAVTPAPIEEVVATIRATKPSLVAAPHVETSAGIILPDDYVRDLASAAHEVGAVMCLDGVASGTAWIDMGDLGVDCYVTAPQKGWSGPAAVGVAMLSESAVEIAKAQAPSSFTIDLAKWHQVMGAYLAGGHMYHATMPTDAIRAFRDVVFETENFGLDKAQDACWRLGMGVRDVLKDRGFKSVAADGFEAPGVAVVFAPDASYAGKFKDASSLQIAAGVPLMIGEPDTYQSFRIGLFGLDKLKDVDLTVANFQTALDTVIHHAA
ncbi:hypothetical protein CTAYLR_007206 [Chrysophaeum taylorii]|uniref:alanine--glyoxylate transaminase n=1 Tax=Chrysophaeum taylorii TaxID=2483200 RepID=A0AAD7UNZ1_9STRA|nr:hypothetical protein CTAYLR_007206 [Chrysophaeum taylorii]